ncbi:hypothetical protein [Nocardia tengchongensis]|uniref:hypothetical protein n=1 Tax=Nocardia tengchongensis TaxID=2055889 RepID=UPI0036BA4D5D
MSIDEPSTTDDPGASPAQTGAGEELRPATRGGRNRLSRIHIAVAASVVVAVASTIGAVHYYLRDAESHELDRSREAARRAACEYGTALATYKADDIDAYFGTVLARATGDWKKNFDSTSKDLREVLIQGKVESKAGEVRCAIESGTAHSATAVVIIDQTISSLGTQGQPRRGQLSITLSLEESGDRWLVNKVSSPLLAGA